MQYIGDFFIEGLEPPVILGRTRINKGIVLIRSGSSRLPLVPLSDRRHATLCVAYPALPRAETDVRDASYGGCPR